jgi:hypothetical protein
MSLSQEKRIMNRSISIGLLAGLGISLSAATHAQNAWDAVGDFSINNSNPNGAWSYHWKLPGERPVPMASAGADCGSAGVICWTRYPGDPLPQIGINTTTSPIEYGSGVGLLNVLYLHPGASNESAIVTWKAPHTSGKVRYLVNGSFQLLDFHNFGYDLKGVKVSVSIDGKREKIEAESLTKFADLVRFKLNKCLKAGDTISFTVDPGDNYLNDLVGLKVGILRSRELDGAPPQQAACD